MSLVERLFPPAELAAMKHAVLAASDEPAAKRRKIGRQGSMHSHRSTDSGYNSDESCVKTTTSKPHLTAPSTRKPSISMPRVPAAPASPHSDEEDFADIIARARARLYSNASLSIPSPAASAHSPSSSSAIDAAPPSPREEYHSPVSTEPLASSDTGCSLGTFINLGLAVTSYERNLLTILVPEPKALPAWQMEAHAAQRMGSLLDARRRDREQQQQERLERERRCSYQGFAVRCHDEEDEEEEEVMEAEGKVEVEVQSQAAPESQHRPVKPIQSMDDFFNIEAASEEADSEASADEEPAWES